MNVVRSYRQTPSEEALQCLPAPFEASPSTSTPEHGVRPVCDHEVETICPVCTTFALTTAGKIVAHFAWLPSTSRVHAHQRFVGEIQVELQASDAPTEATTTLPSAAPNTAAAPCHAAFAHFSQLASALHLLECPRKASADHIRARNRMERSR